MKEWNDKYNPFNSMKVLMYPEHLEGYANNEYLPPITVAIDPINTCNLKCKWCNATKIMDNDVDKMTVEDAEKLSKFLFEWGVKGTCIAGGGEPLLNKEAFNTLLLECFDYKISNSVITNGTLLDDELIKNISYTCRWIGISVDAGCSETFKHIKGVDSFYKVLDNMKKLREEIDKTKSKCTIGYKFLLHPDNQYDILKAVELAKEYGAHDFQLRPVAMPGNNLKYDNDKIDFQIEKALLLNSDNFKVYAVRHKYDANFKPTFDFKKCRACAIHPVFSSNGSLGLCIDRRGDDSLTLCNWKTDNVLDFWNTDKHKKMLKNVNFSECPKCTFNEYNKIVESVFTDDSMCRRHV